MTRVSVALLLSFLVGVQAKNTTLVDVEYCRSEPNKGCYMTGHPTCCSSVNITCPLMQPTCEIGNNTHFGGHYCKQDAADMGCYLDGHPSCCQNGNFTCPIEKPSCEIETPANDWAPYCRVPADGKCYKDGWPACCGYNNMTWTCPFEKPDCEMGSSLGFGGDYCVNHPPDYSCYIHGGYPTCCHDPNVKCPTYKPSCEKQPLLSLQPPPALESQVPDDYCKGAADDECYAGGYPTCCFTSVDGAEMGANCPGPHDVKPDCELGTPSGFGGDYCREGTPTKPLPDFDCYVTGKPMCCDLRENGFKCPTYFPPCELAV